MKKSLCLVLMSCCIAIISLAQSRATLPKQMIQTKGGKVPEIVSNACDTIGFPVPPTYSSIYYTLANNNGFVTGTNSYGDVAKANFWDASANAGTYLSKLFFGIGHCNGPSLTKAISIVVYDGTSGVPGAVLGTINSSMADMKAVADAGGFAIASFSPAISLPASKKVFISFEFPTLVWNVGTDPATKDSFALLSTQFDQPATNIAWEKWGDDTWIAFGNANSWNGRMQLHIYPLVSDNQTCALPVAFGKLSGQWASNAVILGWNTYAELDNQAFEIERSIDGLKYATIGKVATKAVNGNHTGGLSYTFTDAAPLQGQNLYRIKQIDRNGAFAFSNTISVLAPAKASQHIRSFYPNPAGSNLVVEFTKNMNGKVGIQITDAAGKTVLHTKTTLANSRTTTVALNGLKAGIYLLHLTEEGGTVSTLKFVKQ